MKKNIVLFILFFSMIFISACATPYKRAKSPSSDGYYDLMLQESMYEITFNGNSDTPVKISQDYVLLRAAETCIENGYQSFDVFNSTDNSKKEEETRFNNYGNIFAATSTNISPRITLVIKCSKGKDLTFIAEQIKENLRKKYNMDK